MWFDKKKPKEPKTHIIHTSWYDKEQDAFELAVYRYTYDENSKLVIERKLMYLPFDTDWETLDSEYRIPQVKHIF